MTEQSPRVAVVIPCYRETAKVLDVISRIPASVAQIYCVDDACPDGTGAFVEANCDDPRVRVLRNETNQGVGGATVTGYRAALADRHDIVAKIDGDGQMAPEMLPAILRPILAQQADYVKGNRFFLLSDLQAMPRSRVIGNAALSFMSKLSSGYWQVFDPTNGFTAIHARVLELLPLHRLHRGYFFESDMLFRLSTVRAAVTDIPQRAIYGDEQSGVSPLRSVPLFMFRHARNFGARVFYNYFLRDFQLASLEWVLGPLMVVFALGFGGYNWIEHRSLGIEASAGTVMLSALPLIVGLQLILSAIGFDVDNQPREPIHPRLLEDDST